MSELGLQNDGNYAVCFKNFKNISEEETRNIFQKYGNVHSIRQSSESVPWVFIRYKLKEEAQKALDDLQGYKDFEIQVAKSFAKKKPDQDGDRDNFSDRGKGDSFSECSRDNKSNKGAQSRNRDMERSIMDDGDYGSSDAKGTYKKGPYNRKQNNFAERPHRNREGDDFNHNDRVNDTVGARALSPSREMASSKNLRSPNQKHFGGREHRLSERENEECNKSIDSLPPRLVKKSPGTRGVNSAAEIEKNADDDGPPKLVKGSEYYANSVEESTTRSLALRAAHDEVWKNHPLHSERKLREVILTNFDELPSRKDIYELCSPVKPLHVSFGETLSKSIFCRVLVSTETEVKKLYMLNSEELYVTTLEELLDEFFINDGED